MESVAAAMATGLRDCDKSALSRHATYAVRRAGADHWSRKDTVGGSAHHLRRIWRERTTCSPGFRKASARGAGAECLTATWRSRDAGSTRRWIMSFVVTSAPYRGTRERRWHRRRGSIACWDWRGSMGSSPPFPLRHPSWHPERHASDSRLLRCTASR